MQVDISKATGPITAWKKITLHLGYIKSLIAVRLGEKGQSWCRALNNPVQFPGWPSKPPLPPTQGAEDILGVCSQNVAWRFLGRASGTVEKNDTYTLENWQGPCASYHDISHQFKNLWRRGSKWQQDVYVTWKIKAVSHLESDLAPELSEWRRHTHPAHKAGEN